VAVFNRGRTSRLPGTRQILGDWERTEDVDQLEAAGHWDVVIDVASTIPRLMQRLSRALSPVTDRYVFVSTISAYQDWPYEPVDEDSRLWAAAPDYDPGTRAWNPDAYGPLKVGCELAATNEIGDDRLLILRPHVVLGPREYIGRLPWWLSRVERGGPLLVPAPDRSIQPVDVRDLADFTLDRAEAGDATVYNVAAPPGRDTFGGLLAACRDVTGSDAVVEWVGEQWLIEQGVRQWTEIPLWRALPTAWSMSTTRAQAAGLECRPLHETVADTWAWLQSGGRPVSHERSPEHGLAPDREKALIDAWRRRQET
jgi:2'-hydroxyisoflavone reductase